MPTFRPSSQTPLVDATASIKKPVALLISVAIAAITSILYGYHMSELNAPSELVKSHLNITDAQFGLATSLFSVGGMLGSSLASSQSNKHGLRKSFILTLSLNCIGSFIEARSNSLLQLLIGRFTSGTSGGFAIVLVPLYVNSISPALLRGVLGSMTQVSVNLGILIAQISAIFLADETHWRGILDLGWIIGVIGLVLAYFYLEESPRWFVLMENNEEMAMNILVKLRDGDFDQARQEIDDWKTEQGSHTRHIGFFQYLSDPQYNNSKLIATVSMVGQQFSGINSVIFYGVSILNGLFPQWSITINCLISIGNMLITAGSAVFLDRWGRKPMLITSLIGMTVSCLGLFYGIHSNGGPLTVVSIFTYVGSFAIGCGPIPFLLISEVSQMEVKPIAQSWATNCNWISVFIIGVMFPILNESIGSFVYLIFGGIAALFALFVVQHIPETMGKSTYASVWGLLPE